MKAAFWSMKNKGQATIEFLILLPLLLSIILLVAYGGWWSYAKLSAQNFLYSNCTGVSRSRSLGAYTDRGYQAAQNTQRFWQDQAILNANEQNSRLGSEGCSAVLVNKTFQGTNLPWKFTPLVNAFGFAFYAPFISCDQWLCQ